MLWISCFSFELFAETEENQTEVEAQLEVPINFAGVEIAVLHHGIGKLSTEERAYAIERKLGNISSIKLFDVDTIIASKSEKSIDIIANDIVLMSIRKKDAQALNIEQGLLAKQTLEKIKKAIQIDRKKKTPKAILLGVLYALIATIVLFAILLTIKLVFPKLNRLFKNKILPNVKPFSVANFEVFNAEQIKAMLVWLMKTLHTAMIVIVFYFYLPILFSFFPWTTNLAPKLLGYIINPLKKIIFIGINFIPDLITIIVICIVLKFTLTFIRLFFARIGDGTIKFGNFHNDWAEPTYKLTRFFVLAFGLIMIFPYLPGSGSPAFQGVSVFLGLVLSFGSSSSISNVIAGVMLTYMRPFAMGDRVKIADTVGDIIQRNLLVTKIRTIKNVEVTIPNSIVLGGHMINYSSMSKNGGLILNTTITIGYDVDWRKVHELLINAALNVESVLKEPNPFILQTSLDDFYVSYELNAYTAETSSMALTYSLIHQNIQEQFIAADIEIMSPSYAALRDGSAITIPKKTAEAS